MKKIELKYNVINGILRIEIIENKENVILLTANNYKLKDYKDKIKLYNKMLDDFGAEYNEDKAYLLDIICDNLDKNV